MTGKQVDNMDFNDFMETEDTLKDAEENGVY